MNKEIQDIPDADRLLPMPGVPEWLIFLVFFGVVLIIAIILIWHRRRTVMEKYRHRSAAFRLAVAALETWQAGGAQIPIPQLAAGISLVLRGYLEAATGDTALFETREELGQRAGALQQLDDNTRAALMTYFVELSSLEYGPQAEADRDNLLARAGELLEQARHGLES